MDFKKLKNPPIKEVVIALGVSKLFENISELAPVSQYLSTMFKERKESFKRDIVVDDNNVKDTKLLNGYMFISENKKEFFNLEGNRIAFTSREPYTSFDVFFDKFAAILEGVLENKKDIMFDKKIALRYLNIFNVSISTELEKILKFLPNFATQLDGQYYAGLGNFTGVFDLSNNDPIAKANARVNLVLRPLPLKGSQDLAKLSIIFDIDTSKQIEEITLDKIKENLKNLKDFKNQIFFSNINTNLIGDFNE